MSIEEATARVLDVLNELEIPYVLVGAFASNYYGLARSTHDADFVAVFNNTKISSFCHHFSVSALFEPQHRRMYSMLSLASLSIPGE